MSRIGTNEIAKALLAAPGWARVGLSAPTPWVREDAATELARAIAHGIEAGSDGSESPSAQFLDLR